MHKKIKFFFYKLRCYDWLRFTGGLKYMHFQKFASIEYYIFVTINLCSGMNLYTLKCIDLPLTPQGSWYRKMTSHNSKGLWKKLGPMPYLISKTVLFESMCCFGLKYIKNIGMELWLFTNLETLRCLAVKGFLDVSGFFFSFVISTK